MIELFDAARLLPRRDRSLALAGAAMALGLIGLGVHAAVLQRELGSLQAESGRQQAELATFKAAAPPPTPSLLADMELLATRLEAEVDTAIGSGSAVATAPKPSQWLERLDALGSPEVGLIRIEIDRAGSARIEGVAKTPQAMSSYVQAWEHENATAPMRARAIDVRMEDKVAPLLHFQMRANLPGALPR